MDPEGAEQIDAFVAKIEELTQLNEPFHVVRGKCIILLAVRRQLIRAYLYSSMVRRDNDFLRVLFAISRAIRR